MQTVLILANRDFPSLFALNHVLPLLQSQLPLDTRYQLRLSSTVGQPDPSLHALNSLAEFDKKALKHSDTKSSVVSFETLNQGFMLGMKTINLSDDSAVKDIIDLDPVVVVSIRFGQILKHSLIKALACPIFNLHSGVLPNYRGVMATFWAMLNGDNEYGCTVHSIDDNGIDTGAVYGEIVFTLDYSQSYYANVLAIYPLGSKLLVEVIVQHCTEHPVCTQHVKASRKSRYYSYPTSHALTTFENRGMHLYCENDAEVTVNLDKLLKK